MCTTMVLQARDEGLPLPAGIMPLSPWYDMEGKGDSIDGNATVDVLVQRAKASAVKSVMVGGEVIYRDGRFTRVDRDAILAEIHTRFAAAPNAVEAQRRDFARALFPHVRRFYDGYLDGLGDDPHYRSSGRF